MNRKKTINTNENININTNTKSDIPSNFSKVKFSQSNYNVINLKSLENTGYIPNNFDYLAEHKIILYKKIEELELELKEIFLETVAYERLYKDIYELKDRIFEECQSDNDEIEKILRDEFNRINEERKKLSSAQESEKSRLNQQLNQLKSEKSQLMVQVENLERRVIDIEKQIGKY